MNINFSYFFTVDKFPWELMGSDRPCYGSSHSYVCKLIAPYAGQDGNFLRGKPALFEMAKFSDNPAIEDIYRHFTKVYENRDPYNRVSVAQEILDYLRNHSEFKLDMGKRLVAAHQKGNTLPQAAVYYSGNSKDDYNND